MKSRRTSGAVCVLLLLLWGLLVTGGRALSISMDEPLDIISGYLFLARWLDGLWHLPYHIQPPLLNIVHAALLFAARPDVPLEKLAGWGDNYVHFVADFLPYLMPLERTEVLARTPVMLLAVLLGALVFRWGKELAGHRVGLLAVAVLVFDPLLLAHSRFATTDLGVTAAGMAVLYATWRWLRQPSWKWTLVVGVLMGIALLVKYSAFTHAATFALVALVAILCRWKSEGPVRLLQAAVVGCIAFLLVWGAFGFQIGHSSIAPFPVPAPMYWTTFHELWTGSKWRIFVAFGKTWFGPQWWYFPLNFFIKNPIPLLLGLAFSGVTLIRRRPSIRLDLLVLVVFPFLYALTSVSGGMNVSYRHMLPVHPFIYLLVAWGVSKHLQASLARGAAFPGCWQAQKPAPRGAAFPGCWQARKPALWCHFDFSANKSLQASLWRQLTWGLLGLWYVFGTLRLFPDELTYFNEIAGGPERAHRYFVDYTQDWGQSIKELRAYLEAHPGPEARVVYYTHIRPELYGVRCRVISPSPGATERVSTFRPQPGRYVIGTTPLYGLVGKDPLELEWFRRATPEAMVGHALFVYEVKEQPAWIAQCTTPVAPLDDAAIAQGFALTSIRRADFDCTTSWLYPGGGEQMGVYTLHHTLLPLRERCLTPELPHCAPLPADPFIHRHLSRARLSYEQRRDGLLPAFALYELPGGSVPLPKLRSVQGAPAAALPAPEAATLATPVPLDSSLTFLGATAVIVDDELEVETWWQVVEQPVPRLFSIMAHLLTAQGETLGVADGLGVYPVVLRPGDVFVQRHRFPRPPEGVKVWLRTGVYWLDTMERWQVANTPGIDALFVPLEEK